MKKTSATLTPRYIGGEFEELFEAAKSSNIAAEEVVLYGQSLSRLRSIQAGMAYHFEEGREEGVSTVARNLKTFGMDINTILKLRDYRLSR